MLWKLLDRDAEEVRASRKVTADAIVEVQRYLSAPPPERSQDPLVSEQPTNQYHLATPASSEPSKRMLSKVGEIVSKKRKRLKPSTVEKLVFTFKKMPHVTQAPFPPPFLHNI